jgi:DNA repair exonuclease SbcCD nuclease subunit
MSKIRILHISDIHLTDQGISIWGVNTMEHFHRLVGSIKTHSDIDAIIISGDLSNDGSKWSYEYADNVFSQLGIPTYVCMGNHDNFVSLNNHTHYCKNVRELQIKDWGFLFLNSVIPDIDNPEKNKIGIYKKVTRQLHHLGENEYYIKYRGYKWVVFFIDENNVKLKYQI